MSNSPGTTAMDSNTRVSTTLQTNYYLSINTGFAAVNSDRYLIFDHGHIFREGLFACTTSHQVECAVAFARYLSVSGINNENFWLFLRMIMTNNAWVIDELLQHRNPRLLFSTIRATPELLQTAFEILYSRHPEELHVPALEAILGIIENAYFDPDDGFTIYRLSIMDINALGKFLIKDEGQDHPINSLILNILDRLAQIGGYNGEPTKNILSKQAFNVRYAYFDRTRNLVDAIPEPLLVRLKDPASIEPSEEYSSLLSKRRGLSRNRLGKFARNHDQDAVPHEQASDGYQRKKGDGPNDANGPN